MPRPIGTMVAGLAVMMVGISGHTQAAEITLRAASCFPIGSPPSRSFEALVKQINARGKGVVQIKMVGGAPAIGSPFTLTQKVAAGAYDIVGCTEAYFGNVLPEGPVLRFAEKSYAELRKNGGLDYVQKLFGAKGLHFLVRHADNGPFHLWTSRPINKPNLKGLHLRVSPVYTAFFTSLGATVQQSNIQQVYTYMENGTVQGYGWPIAGWVPSWIKVTKYRIDPGFYNSTLHTLVNLRKWKSLSKQQQDLLMKIGLEFEARAEPDSPEMTALVKKQRAWLDSKGMKTITFEGADRKKWVEAAKSSGWKEVLDRSPKHGPKLKELFTK